MSKDMLTNILKNDTIQDKKKSIILILLVFIQRKGGIELNSIYIYTMSDFIKDFNKPRSTINSRIDKLNLKNDERYMQKVEENGKEKIYYTQLAYDLLRNYNEEQKKESAETKQENDEKSENIETIPYTLYKEVTDDLRAQLSNMQDILKNKDIQIQQLHEIIAVKEKTTLAEKQLLLGTKDTNSRGFFSWFKKKHKEDTN